MDVNFGFEFNWFKAVEPSSVSYTDTFPQRGTAFIVSLGFLRFLGIFLVLLFLVL